MSKHQTSKNQKAISVASHTVSSQGVLVLGMHRSGTSVVTSILKDMGFALGRFLIQNDEYNEAGYWENTEIVLAHDEFYGLVKSAWHDTRPIPNSWFQDHAAQIVTHRLKSIFAEQFAGAPRWLIKDPRLCRLLPLWSEVFDSLAKAPPACLLMVRHPFAVLRSLVGRNGFSQEHALMLWLRHTLDAERHSRGMTRSVLSLERFQEEPVGSLSQALEALGCHDLAANREQLAEAISRRWQPNLMHGAAQLPSLAELAESYPLVAATLEHLLAGDLDANVTRRLALDAIAEKVGKLDVFLPQLYPTAFDYGQNAAHAKALGIVHNDLAELQKGVLSQEEKQRLAVERLQDDNRATSVSMNTAFAQIGNAVTMLFGQQKQIVETLASFKKSKDQEETNSITGYEAIQRAYDRLNEGNGRLLNLLSQANSHLEQSLVAHESSSIARAQVGRIFDQTLVTVFHLLESGQLYVKKAVDAHSKIGTLEATLRLVSRGVEEGRKALAGMESGAPSTAPQGDAVLPKVLQDAHLALSTAQAEVTRLRQELADAGAARKGLEATISRLNLVEMERQKEQEARLQAQVASLSLERERALLEGTLAQRDDSLRQSDQERVRLAAERDKLQSQLEGLTTEVQTCMISQNLLQQECDKLRSSYSWKVTAPLRLLGRIALGLTRSR